MKFEITIAYQSTIQIQIIKIFKMIYLILNIIFAVIFFAKTRQLERKNLGFIHKSLQILLIVSISYLPQGLIFFNDPFYFMVLEDQSNFYGTYISVVHAGYITGISLFWLNLMQRVSNLDNIITGGESRITSKASMRTISLLFFLILCYKFIINFKFKTEDFEIYLFGGSSVILEQKQKIDVSLN